MTIAPEILIPFAEQLATVSGEIIRRYFRKDFAIEAKRDTTPVTTADKEVERALRAMINNAFPDHGVLGEEFENTKTDAEYLWVLDPIDGTKSFMIGRPIFGTLIGLVRKGIPMLGIIDQPILGERWTGVRGFATNFNYVETCARQCSSLKEATLCTTSPSLFSGKAKEQFERLAAQVKYVVYGGDCYSYGLLANGSVDIVVESGLKPHDFCALEPVVRGARGFFTDWQGNDITLASDGNVLACGDKRVQQEVLELLS